MWLTISALACCPELPCLEAGHAALEIFTAAACRGSEASMGAWVGGNACLWLMGGSLRLPAYRGELLSSLQWVADAFHTAQ